MMIRKIWQFLWYRNRNNFEKNEKRKDQAPLSWLYYSCLVLSWCWVLTQTTLVEKPGLRLCRYWELISKYICFPLVGMSLAHIFTLTGTWNALIMFFFCFFLPEISIFFYDQTKKARHLKTWLNEGHSVNSEIRCVSAIACLLAESWCCLYKAPTLSLIIPKKQFLNYLYYVIA